MTLARTLTIPVKARDPARERNDQVGRAHASHALEARLVRSHSPAPLAVVAPPHPLYGGTIGNPVVRALEHAFQSTGHWTLAFNFRGIGESTGSPSGEPSDALSDYLTVAQSVPDARPAWLSGYSFGAVAALAAAIELQVPRVLLVAPQLGVLDPELFARYSGHLAIALASEDDYAPPDAVRAMLQARVEARTEAQQPCGEAVVHVVDGADHFFLGSARQPLADALDALLAGEAHA